VEIISQQVGQRRLRRRGPVLEEANRLSRPGTHPQAQHRQPRPRRSSTHPDDIVAAIVRNLPNAVGYSDSKGLFSARTAVAQYYTALGVDDVDVDSIIWQRRLRADRHGPAHATEPGDEVLIPAPDYPLVDRGVHAAGGRPVHYLCDEGADWMPDLADVEAKITERTRALVVINPNNPTGAVVLPRHAGGSGAIARRHNLCCLRRDL